MTTPMPHNAAEHTANVEIVRTWLLDVSAPTQPKKRRAVFFTLYQNTDHGGLQPYTSDQYGDDLKELESLTEEQREAKSVKMAESFVAMAERLAAHCRQPQTFGISAFHSVGGTAAPISHCPFNIKPDLSALSEYIEEPNQRGMNSQAMRGYEIASREATARLREHTALCTRVLDEARDVRELLANRNRYLEDQQIPVWTALRDSINQNIQAMSAANIAILGANRTERHWVMGEQALMQYGPLLLSALLERAGKGPIASIIQSATPEQKQMAVEVLLSLAGDDPEKKKMVMQAMEIHMGVKFERTPGQAPQQIPPVHAHVPEIKVKEPPPTPPKRETH